MNTQGGFAQIDSDNASASCSNPTSSQHSGCRANTLACHP